MTTTLEELKSDVDALRARADMADSNAMETKQLLVDLKTDVAGVKSDVGGLYRLMAAVPDDIIRIDANVADIKRDVAGLTGSVTDLKRDTRAIMRHFGIEETGE
jgi:hypothetical protein